MCGNVCVIYGWLMLSRSGRAEIIYELIAIISKCQTQYANPAQMIRSHTRNLSRNGPIQMNAS